MDSVKDVIYSHDQETDLAEYTLNFVSKEGYTRMNPDCTYPGLDTDKWEMRLMLNLAMLEHLRWVSSHQLLGYKPGAKKDEIRLVHPCMIPWHHLDDETKSYDFAVVETTLYIENNIE